MIPRGKMYSDQVGQWSPRNSRRSGQAALDEANQGHSAGDDAGRDYARSGAAHRLHSTERGSLKRPSQGEAATVGRGGFERWQANRHHPASRRRVRNSSAMSMRSPPPNCSQGLQLHIASPECSEGDLGGSRRQPSAGRSPQHLGGSRCRPLPQSPQRYGRHHVRGDEASGAAGSAAGRWNDQDTTNPCPSYSRGRRYNCGGGMGLRGRGRQPFPTWGRFGGRARGRNRSRSPTMDSDEEHRRSRSREKARRRRQVSFCHDANHSDMIVLTPGPQTHWTAYSGVLLVSLGFKCIHAHAIDRCGASV